MIDAQLRQTINRLTRGEAPWPLFLSGPPGVGKTCASLCLLDYSSGGFYVTAAVLCEWANAAAFGRLQWSDMGLDNGGAPGIAGLWRALAETSLVVLDDLGTRDKASDAHYETIKRLLDEREGRPLVVISNLDFAALVQAYDARVCSRLAGGTSLYVPGVDRRLDG